MKQAEATDELIKLPVEKIINLIRNMRNSLIKDFLVDNNLKLYFRDQYNITLSPVKQEFLKRDVKDLLATPLDLSHYAPLIRIIREANRAALTEGNDKLFYQELEAVFKRYNY